MNTDSCRAIPLLLATTRVPARDVAYAAFNDILLRVSPFMVDTTQQDFLTALVDVMDWGRCLDGLPSDRVVRLSERGILLSPFIKHILLVALNISNPAVAQELKVMKANVRILDFNEYTFLKNFDAVEDTEERKKLKNAEDVAHMIHEVDALLAGFELTWANAMGLAGIDFRVMRPLLMGTLAGRPLPADSTP